MNFTFREFKDLHSSLLSCKVEIVRIKRLKRDLECIRESRDLGVEEDIKRTGLVRLPKSQKVNSEFIKTTLSLCAKLNIHGYKAAQLLNFSLENSNSSISLEENCIVFLKSFKDFQFEILKEILKSDGYKDILDFTKIQNEILESEALTVKMLEILILKYKNSSDRTEQDVEILTFLKNQDNLSAGSIGILVSAFYLGSSKDLLLLKDFKGWKNDILKNTFLLFLIQGNESKEMLETKKEWFNSQEKLQVFQFLRSLVDPRGYGKEIFGFSDEVVDAAQEFSEYIFDILRQLTKNICINMKHYLRNMLAIDQDASVADENTKTAWEELLMLITELYNDRDGADAAIEWWTNGDLFNFQRLASDVWCPKFLELFVNMLSSLSSGPASSSKAHEVLNSEGPGYLGLILWSTFFRTLNNYLEKMSAEGSAMELKPSEAGLIHGFLKLLGTVAKYSDSARRVLCENQHYRALFTLFQVLTSRVSVDLKASILDAIAAFCVPSEETSDIALQVWSLLEQCQIVPTISLDINRMKKTGGFSFKSMSGINGSSGTEGIAQDIRDIETINQTYPETIAFLRLIKILLSNPDSGLIASVYEELGVSQRTPGIRLYISFIIDVIFLKMNSRQYRHMSEKWTIYSLCLDIFILSLNYFDLSPDTVIQETKGKYYDEIRLMKLGLHPGFEVLSQTLCGGELISTIFRILSESVENVNANIYFTEYHSRAICSALKLLAKIFGIQRPFFERLCPALLELPDFSLFAIQSSMTGLDQLLAFHKDTVLNIANFINCYISDELCLYSVKVINILSQSPIFSEVDEMAPSRINRLCQLIASSDDSNNILYGYIDRLEVDVDEHYSNFSETYIDNAGAEGLVHLVRMEIMNLLITNADSTIGTISHFLLGFELDKDMKMSEIPDPTNPGSRLSCFHSLVTLLSKGSNRENDFDSSPFSISHPVMSEKCYQLLYTVCSNSITYGPAMRYLRTHGDFFCRQIACMPVNRESDLMEQRSVVLCARLRQNSWLIKLLALEIHLASVTGRKTHVAKLISIIFSTTGRHDGNLSSLSLSAANDGYEQPLNKITDILNCMDFSVPEGISLDLSESIFAGIDLDQYKLINGNGNVMYDLETIHKILMEHILNLEKQGNMITAGARMSAREDLRTILEILLKDNENCSLASARTAVVSSWSELVRCTLSLSDASFNSVVSPEMIFDLLGSMIRKVTAQNASSLIIGYVSEVILSLLVKLREIHSMESQFTNRLNFMKEIGVPVDFLLHTVLRGLLDCMLIPGLSSTTRGNYEAALLVYLLFTKSEISLKELQKSSYFYSLVTGNLSVIKGFGDKIINVICNDIFDGEELWKLVALASLESLYDLAEGDRKLTGSSENHILSFLAKKNYVGQFVYLMRRKYDKQLQNILISEEDGLQILYSYQLNMSLLNKIAESPQGAEMLMRANIFEVIEGCEFLETRPEANEYEGMHCALIVIGSDELSLSPREKYHEMLIPVLNLILKIILTKNSQSRLAAKGAAHLLSSRHSVFSSILNTRHTPITLQELTEVNLLTNLLESLAFQGTFLRIPGIHETVSYSSLLMSLFYKFYDFNDPKWIASLKPINASDVDKSQTLPTSTVSNSSSLFHQEAKRTNCKNIRNILLYFVYYTESIEDGIQFAMSSNHSKTLGNVVYIIPVILLPILSKLLTVSVTFLNSYTNEYNSIQEKSHDINRISFEEINDIIQGHMTESLSLSQKRHLALNELYHLSLERKREIAIFIQILESGCTLLWRGICSLQAKVDLCDFKHEIETLTLSISNMIPILKDLDFLDKDSLLFLEGIYSQISI